MDLWTAATTDLDAERHERLVTTARLACVGDFAFAAQATTRDGFEDRLALVAERVDDKIASLVERGNGVEFDAVKEAVLAGWREDFEITASSFDDGIERIKAETDPAVLRKMLDQNANLRGLGVEFSTMDKLDAQDEAARARLKELKGSKVAAADDTPMTCSSCGNHLKVHEAGQFGGKCMSCYAGKKGSKVAYYDNGPADENDGISYGDDDRYDYGRMDEEPRSRPSFDPFYVKYTCPQCGEQNVRWVDDPSWEIRCSHGHRVFNNVEVISVAEAHRLNRSTANEQKIPLVPGRTAAADPNAWRSQDEPGKPFGSDARDDDEDWHSKDDDYEAGMMHGASALTAPYDADWAHDDPASAEAGEVQDQGSLSTPSDSSVLAMIASETDAGTLKELIATSDGDPRYVRLVAAARQRMAVLRREAASDPSDLCSYCGEEISGKTYRNVSDDSHGPVRACEDCIERIRPRDPATIERRWYVEGARKVAEFPPKKKDDGGDDKPKDEGSKNDGGDKPPSDDAPPKDDAAPAAPAPAAGAPNVGPAQPAAPAAPPHGNPQPAQTNAPNPAAPGTPAPADPGSDPAQMEVGATSQMTYTMTDGNSGHVEVVFIREDKGVYYFNGPSGEFGVTNTSGSWQDAEGNTFTFASGDGSSNDDDPMKAKEADPDVAPAAPADEKPADDGEKKEDGDDKKDGPPWAKK